MEKPTEGGLSNLKRRTFLASAAALAVMPTTPPPAARAIAGEAMIGVDMGAPSSERTAWWGWSSDQEVWHGPFDNRAEAIEDAEENEADGFDTALCHPRTLGHPDYRDDIVNWLCDGSPRAGGSLACLLARSFEGTNQEDDWEGEVGDAIGQADWEDLAGRFEPLIDMAVMRSGLFVIGPYRNAMFEDSEPLLDALQHDETFGRDLQAAATAWSDANGLLVSTLMVDVTDEQSTPAREETAT